MGTYTIDQYQKRMRGMAKELKRAGAKSTSSAAQFMVATARGMAPRKSGNLRRGIRAKPIENNKWEVISTVPGKFPYQFWINQQAPFRSVKMVWNGRQKTVYGDGSHRNTGTPRYWHLATLRTSKLFGKVARANIQKVLRTRLG